MTATTNDRALGFMFSPGITGLSDGRVQGPQPTPARWLADVERRIRDSIVPENHIDDNDGRWINLDVANSAIQFFRQASELLPGEPFIYSSGSGDLVAEFKARFGMMTSVVMTDKFLAMVVMDGQSEPITVKLGSATESELKRELKPLTDFLTTGHHARPAGT